MRNTKTVLFTLFIFSLFFGCGKQISRKEYSPDKKFFLDFSYESKLPLVSYDVYVIVKRTSDNQSVSEKTYIGEIDAPEDMCENDRFRVLKWSEKNVILIYKQILQREIPFKESLGTSQ